METEACPADGWRRGGQAPHRVWNALAGGWQGSEMVVAWILGRDCVVGTVEHLVPLLGAMEETFCWDTSFVEASSAELARLTQPDP